MKLLRTVGRILRKIAALRIDRLYATHWCLPLELSESGDEVIMSIAVHVSRAMLSRYSHARMEAKRRALDEIAARQRAADENRRRQLEQRQQAGMVSQPGAVQ